MNPTTLRDDLLQCFPDKAPYRLSRLAIIIDLLQENARVTITDMAQHLNLPISTVYEDWLLLQRRLNVRTVFSPNLEAIPQPAFRCPECKSQNTMPTSRYNHVTGKTKITGLVCHVCQYQARRGELSPTLMRAMEG